MSLRRPTVVLLSFTFNISPFCDVAQTSDCGMHCYLYSIISPLCDVALTPDCGIVISFVSSRGVIQTLDWPSVLHWDFGRTTARLPFYFPTHCYLMVWVRITNLLMCIMFAFVISYVRTVLWVHSKYSPGLLIWPDVDEGDLLDEEFDSASDA